MAHFPHHFLETGCGTKGPCSSNSWNDSQTGLLTSCSGSEAILLPVSIPSEAISNWRMRTVKKDGAKLVQCTLPLTNGPIVPVWEERDKATEEQIADEL